MNELLEGLMNCRSIEYVVALNQLGSLQAAAEYCHATPGTVSGQISRMEAYLDTRLFESRTKPARATEQGKLLIEHMTSIVTHLKKLRDIAGGMQAVGV